MKNLLDWRTKEVVNIFDEVTLWSAPFGEMLLKHIPMKEGASVVDIGFGTGFPLIELSQRFGESSTIYGVDIWEQGIDRTKEKITTLGLNNIKILENSAASIAIRDNSIDLVSSNLGINNFEEKQLVYSEIHRILNSDGRLCITTNPIGTFEELFRILMSTCKTMGLETAHQALKHYVNNRSTEQQIVEEFNKSGFELVLSHSNVKQMRFVDAQAIFDHSLIRIGFREYWEQMLQDASKEVFEKTIQQIEQVIADNGVFKMTIPMLYLEFKKA